ncbi:hypothetical protein CHS0354_031293 [Potamilus streckersoni]|uniref:Uncharacterized protein n=1 Tax=Potamilus streckersoni TaxID=2493646 RepID=A0AAE0TCN6_9BIVA|nr:hypothetical protein CHS0354_031293 [Potamilus streckersoni]
MSEEDRESSYAEENTQEIESDEEHAEEMYTKDNVEVREDNELTEEHGSGRQKGKEEIVNMNMDRKTDDKTA